MDVVIQAGGQGQRIQSVAGRAAKPMLRVGGEPMISRFVRQMAPSGARRLAVVVPHRDVEFRDFLPQLARGLGSVQLERAARPLKMFVLDVASNSNS